jgi:hypothetical protein
MEKTVVLGIKLSNRVNTAQEFQKVISDHGCQIKTRIGIHQAYDGKCSPSGVILLDVIGTDEEVATLENDLKAIPYAEIQKMVFSH